MNIDIARVNLLEKDIEDWLYENPGDVPATYGQGAIKKWIGRQYALPSGIADLIGVRESGLLTVIEVKNVPINKAAVLQVCRYAHDLKHIVSERMDYPHVRDDNEPVIEMILIGPSIDAQTFTEAQAVGVNVFQFSVTFSVEIERLSWNKEHRTRIRDQHGEIAARPEWEIYGLTNAEDYAQFRREQAQLAEQGVDDVFESIAAHAREYAAAHGDTEGMALETPDESDDTTP